MIDQVLNIITKAAWFIFAGYAIVSFIHTFRRYGLTVAILSMFSTRIVLPLLLVGSINLLSMALNFIEPQRVGIVISVSSRAGIRDQPVQPGLHWILPFLEKVVEYPTYWQTYTMSGKPLEGQLRGNDAIRARTSDGQEVFIDCSLIFRVDAEQVVRIHLDWQNRYIDDLIRPVVRGLVRTQVSQFTVEEVNSNKRGDLEATLDRLLKDELNEKGLLLDQFLLRDITFSPQFSDSIEKKQIALEGQLEKEYQAEQIRQLAKGKADAVLIEAEAEAKALQLIAEVLEDNPNLIIHEYVKKLSPNISVMLLPSDNPLILPLPTLEAVEPLTNTLLSTPIVASPTPTPTPQP